MTCAVSLKKRREGREGGKEEVFVDSRSGWGAMPVGNWCLIRLGSGCSCIHCGMWDITVCWDLQHSFSQVTAVCWLCRELLHSFSQVTVKVFSYFLVPSQTQFSHKGSLPPTHSITVFQQWSGVPTNKKKVLVRCTNKRHFVYKSKGKI